MRLSRFSAPQQIRQPSEKSLYGIQYLLEKPRVLFYCFPYLLQPLIDVFKLLRYLIHAEIQLADAFHQGSQLVNMLLGNVDIQLRCYIDDYLPDLQKPTDWNKVYDIIQKMNARVEKSTNISDLFKLTTKSVRLNPKYIAPSKK